MYFGGFPTNFTNHKKKYFRKTNGDNKHSIIGLKKGTDKLSHADRAVRFKKEGIKYVLLCSQKG